MFIALNVLSISLLIFAAMYGAEPLVVRAEERVWEFMRRPKRAPWKAYPAALADVLRSTPESDVESFRQWTSGSHGYHPLLGPLTLWSALFVAVAWVAGLPHAGLAALLVYTVILILVLVLFAGRGFIGGLERLLIYLLIGIRLTPQFAVLCLTAVIGAMVFMTGALLLAATMFLSYSTFGMTSLIARASERYLKGIRRSVIALLGLSIELMLWTGRLWT